MIKESDIKNSHERCRNIGIDTEQVFSKKILDEIELNIKYVINRELIINALPHMENLVKYSECDEFFYILTDCDGCILSVIGDEKIVAEISNMKIIPGAYMDEENIGTNSIGMAIKNKCPAMISSSEHYIKAYSKWTSFAAPIKDNNDLIIGILSIVGTSVKFHPHTIGMIMSSCSSIKKMIEIQRLNKIQYVIDKHIKTVFDAIPKALIISDIEGKIRTYNKKALEIFRATEEQLKSLKVKDVVKDWDNIIKEIYLSKSVSMEVSILNNSKYRLMAKPIYNTEDNIIEIVYIFEELSKSRNFSDKFKNYQAFYTFDKIISEEESITCTIEYAKKISNNKGTVLITGESGTGKNLFAESIHNYSSRMDGPFVKVNCSSILKPLIESELFGYEYEDTISGKKEINVGKLELADGGTIFIEEVGNLSRSAQTKILKMIQEGVITRVGSNRPIPVDVRIITSSSKNLKEEVEKGNLRKDLFYRLNVLPIYLPPLRNRKSDISVLTEHFMKIEAQKCNKNNIIIPQEYSWKMLSYNWPGNVEELKNIVKLIVEAEMMPIGYFSEKDCKIVKLLDLNKEHLKFDYIEKQHILKVLKIFKGNITHAAEILGMQRNTLYNKIKKHGISVSNLG